MTSQVKKQGFIWGALLIVMGIMALLETFTELSAWVWIAVLVLAGLGAFVFWLAGSGEHPWEGPWAPLIPAYVLWAVAALVAGIELNVLRDPFIAPFVLAVIALPFLLTFVRDRGKRWALIPTYILLAVGLMVLLTDSGVMDGGLVPPYVLFAIALPFLVVFARDTKQWWALIPGGILAVIGVSFLIAESAAEYIGAAALVVAGIWIIVRQFGRPQADAEDAADQAQPRATLEAKADEPPAE